MDSSHGGHLQPDEHTPTVVGAPIQEIIFLNQQVDEFVINNCGDDQQQYMIVDQTQEQPSDTIMGTVIECPFQPDAAEACPDMQAAEQQEQSIPPTEPATLSSSVQCSICGLHLKHRRYLKVHMFTHTSDKPFHCPDCPKTFQRPIQLKNHSKVHRDARAGKPESNELTEPSPASTDATAAGTVECPTCGVRLKQRKNLLAHMATHTGNKQHHCPDCPKTFLRASHLKSHSKVHTGDRPFKCDQCQRTFAQSSNFLVHQRLHRSRTPFNCRHCCKRYATQAELDEHHAYHVAPNQFRCVDCGKTYRTVVSLRYHRLTHTGERPFVCRACGKRFVHSSVLSVHMRTHTGAKPYKCAQCDQRFSQWTNYNRHRKRAHAVGGDGADVASDNGAAAASQHLHVHRGKADPDQQQLVCDVCNRTFKTTKGLERHQLVHNGHCSYCNVTIAGSERAYRRHMRMHGNKHADTPQVFDCAMCGVELPSSQLDEHVRRVHAVGGYAWHGCPFCELEFAHTGVLLVHLREHQGLLQNEMQCSECGCMFKRFSYYKKHRCFLAKQKRVQQVIETGVEPLRPGYRPLGHQLAITTASVAVANSVPEESITRAAVIPKGIDEGGVRNETANAADLSHSCPVCQKPFRNAKAVRMHMPTHGPKRFQCEFCAKHFVRLSQLNTHRTMHTGERPFECPVCARRFAQACMVQVHLRTHTGAKPFRCAHCEKCFAQAANLKRHEETHTDVRPYVCRACGKRFQRKFTLQMHEKRHGGLAVGDCDPIERLPIKRQQPATTKSQPEPTAMPTRSQPSAGSADKPFPCQVCRKTFAQASSLQVHMRVHTGDKPYPCDVCPKTFRQWTHLNRHRSVHTGQKAFGCSRCEKRFARLESLQAHERKHERAAAEIGHFPG